MALLRAVEREALEVDARVERLVSERDDARAGARRAFALGDVVEDRPVVAELRARLVARLATIGVVPVAAGGTFVVADVGDARRFAERMLARGVRVRDCASFGLPRLVRVGVRGDADQARLVEAWAGV